MPDKKISLEYHGEQITFDEDREEWKVVINFKGQYHKSLQVIKNYIDRRNKKKFDRVLVFIEERTSYFARQRGFIKAVITSVGVDGTVFVVREGQKNAEHCGTAYSRNKENVSLIKKIGIAQRKKESAEKEYRELRESLEAVDFNALRKKALGEE